jgi:ankyrin repeat protein
MQSLMYFSIISSLIALLSLLFAAPVIAMDFDQNPSKKQKVEKTSSDNKKLHTAVCVGNLEQTQKLLDEGWPIECVDDIFDTPLTSLIRYVTSVVPPIQALCPNYLKIVKLLLRKNVNVDRSITYAGYSPFTSPPSLQSPVEVISRCVMSSWFQRNDQDFVSEFYYELLKTLLQHDADPNLVYSLHKDTPLHILAQATKARQYRFLLLLLQYEADANVKNSCGLTPLQLAVSDKNLYTTSALLGIGGASAKGVNLRHLPGYTFLIRSIITDNPKRIAYALRWYTPRTTINKKAAGDMTPLEWAVCRILSGASKNILRVLLKSRNLNLDSLTAGGSSMLNSMIKARRSDLAKMLLNARASVDTADSKGNSSLHTAVTVPHSLRMIKLLLQYHPNILLENSTGQTAACVAQEVGRLDYVNIIADYAREQVRAALVVSTEETMTEEAPILGSFGARVREVSAQVGYILSNLPVELLSMIIIYTLGAQGSSK